MLENIHTKFQDNLTKFRDFGILGGKSPPGGRMGGISENWRGHSLSNGVQSIHTEIQGNRTIFQDGGIWGVGISPPGGERGEFRKTDRTLILVTCQRTYIQNLKLIGQYFKMG